MKKLKIFLIVSLVIILGAGGYLLYMFKFKEYDVADEEVKEIVSDSYKVELPGGVIITLDENGQVVEETKMVAENTDSNSITTSSDPSTGTTTVVSSNSSNKKNNEAKTPTVSSIKEKYGPALEGLEAQAETKINALINRAKSEYLEKKENGSSIDFGYFYNKYMSAAKDLEASTDIIFQAVLHSVEKDLVANGFDKAYAQSIKDKYEATKKERRNSILSRAMENR